MAYSLIVNVGAGGSGPTNAVTTGAIDTTGADLIVVGVSGYGGSLGNDVTDSKGNTWTRLTAAGTVLYLTDLYYSRPTSVGASHTFTYTPGTGYLSICVAAFAGSVASPFDQESATDASATPGSITPSEDNCLLVTQINSDPDTPSAVSGGFVLLSTVTYSNGQHLGAGQAYLIQTSAAAANPTWTGGSRGCVMASFKAAAGGATTWGPLLGLQNNRLVNA